MSNMGNGIAGFGPSWVLILAIAAAGCSTGADQAQVPVSDRHPVKSFGAAEDDALLVRTDTARGRRWVLGLEDVRVYDIATNALVRRITLPDWSVARSVCAPDLMVDASGSALVSSNVQPRLWRIDAATLEVSRHDIVLHGKERWDIGFGSLVHTANGSIYALTSNGISLWKVDSRGGQAEMVEFYLSPMKACSIPRSLVARIERNHKMSASITAAQLKSSVVAESSKLRNE